MHPKSWGRCRSSTCSRCVDPTPSPLPRPPQPPKPPCAPPLTQTHPPPACAFVPQLEALYALLDDDGSGTLTVHEMIDLFVSSSSDSHRPPSVPPRPAAAHRRVTALPPVSAACRTVSTTMHSSSMTATATRPPTTGAPRLSSAATSFPAAPSSTFAAHGARRLGDGYCDDGTDADDGGLDCTPSCLLSTHTHRRRSHHSGLALSPLSLAVAHLLRSQLQHLPVRRQRLRRFLPCRRGPRPG